MLLIYLRSHPFKFRNLIVQASQYMALATILRDLPAVILMSTVKPFSLRFSVTHENKS